MKLAVYFYITKDKSIRVTKYQGQVMANETCMLLNFDIPDSIFDKPALEANIVVDNSKKTVSTVKIEANALLDWIDSKKK